MKTQRSRKKKRICLWLLIGCVLGLLALIPIHRVNVQKKQMHMPEELSPAAAASVLDEYRLNSDLTIERAVSWSGSYVEDGTDEAVSGVFALVLKNTSSRTLQYAELTVTCGNETYRFTLSTVPAGQSVLVQEAGRKPMPEDLTDAAAELTLYTDFSETPDLCPDVFEVYVDGNQITVKNKGNQDAGDVYVYYKTFADDQYLGGITYRAKIDRIAGGESGSITPTHYHDGSSRLMFITYVS